jgi:hypothetical protein
MVEVFELPASRREITIHDCTKLKSIFSRRLQQGQSASSNLQGPSSVYPVSLSSDIASAEDLLFLCLESINIHNCEA